MVSNRAWCLVGRWLLTTLTTAVIARWLRCALEDRPRLRRAHATEEEVGLSASRYAQFMQFSPMMLVYRRIALLAGQRLAAAGSDSGQPRRVLDVGCGPGTLATAIAAARPDATVLALDRSADMLHAARRQRHDSRVYLIQGDGAALPLREETVDLTVATLALHHWHDGEAVLREVRRVLPPTGQVLLFDLRRDMSLPIWLLMHLATLFLGRVARLPGDDPAASVASAYTPAEAEWLAGRAGLRGVFARSGFAWLWLDGTRTRLPPSPVPAGLTVFPSGSRIPSSRAGTGCRYERAGRSI